MNDTILIVEDEVRLRFLLRDYLKKDGFTVLEASDGEEALNIFSQNNVNLIVLDVMMPRINGYKISRLLKFDAKYKNIPILMVTARSQEEDKLIGEETGADEYITKPFDLDEVVKTVQKYLNTEN